MYLILSFIQSDYVIVSVSIWRFVSDVQTSVPHKHYTGIDMTLKSINRVIRKWTNHPTTIDKVLHESSTAATLSGERTKKSL